MVLDLGVLQDGGSDDSDTVADDDVRADDDVGADGTALADFGRRVDQDVTTSDKVCLGQVWVVLLCLGGEVETHTGQEVLWLADVHPVALQVVGVELLLLNQEREGLALDGGWSHLDEVDDGGVEDVDTGVDSVADKLDGLFDESVDSVGHVSVVDNDTVLGRLVDLGGDNGGLTVVGVVEVEQVLQRVLADDVGVQHEDRGVVLLEDLFGQLERACGAQRLFLDGEGDRHPVDLLVLLQRANHHLWLVVDGKNDVCAPGVGQRLDLVQDHRSVGKLNQRLWVRQRERSQSGTVTTDKN